MVPPTSHYRLPDLLALFPSDISNTHRSNPHFYQLDTLFDRWLQSLHLNQSTEEGTYSAQTLKKIQMPVLICYAYPDASLDQLKTCLNYLVLAFIFEEITDATSSAQSQRLADIYIDMYRGTCSVPPDSAEALHPLLPAMKSLANGVMSSIGPAFREKFISENFASAQAIVQEAFEREQFSERLHAKPKSLESYYDNRHATVGLTPFLILAQWVYDMNLPSDPTSLHALDGMSKATVEMVFLANDIYSFKKERLANDTQNNVITVIMDDESTGVHHGDLQGSFEYCHHLFQRALVRLGQHHQALLESSLISMEQRHSVEKYKQALMDCIVGNIKWSMVCRRYAVFEDERQRAVGEVVIV